MKKMWIQILCCGFVFSACADYRATRQTVTMMSDGMPLTVIQRPLTPPTESLYFDKGMKLNSASEVFVIRMLHQVVQSGVIYDEVRLSGHTDSVETHKYSQGLSLKRAELIKKLFINHGIPAHKIIVKGYANTEPIVDASQCVGIQSQRHQCERVNRRVSFDFVGAKHAMPSYSNSISHKE